MFRVGRGKWGGWGAGRYGDEGRVTARGAWGRGKGRYVNLGTAGSIKEDDCIACDAGRYGTVGGTT
eukprot:COSAG02_NODE_55021_length_293_cov_0.396907_1_plen_65_part_01